ncbi:MAG: hypothetical protein DRJ37_03920 [Thermoprotei archaeon]|nr:MAG: hypothetical protein DRJ37_03920 [Thermoprotei archaeon]
MSIKIEEISFGFIVVNGRRYEYDIIICGDKILRRFKDISKKYKGRYGHTPLSLEEVSKTLKLCPGANTVIIGKGIYGALPIPKEVINYIEEHGLKLVIVETSKLPEILASEAEKGKVLAIVHVTC